QAGELTEADQAMLRRVVDAIQETMKVGCTACGYCQPCPKNVDIPGVFACYNRVYSENRSAAVLDYMKCTAFRKDSTAASRCIGCGKCEQHCPQGIEIRKHLKDAANVLETPVYKIMRKGIEIIKAF
ncbi:MAG: 4Fe-4S dicluster domain-containing protein, partial [Oscillospiraceae bacterium]|nr:4Fe-4S dicluster domain-containing protein [Oscillospiraceae bacterium]